MFKKYYNSLLNNTLTVEEKKNLVALRLQDVYRQSVSIRVNNKMLKKGGVWNNNFSLPGLSKINIKNLKEKVKVDSLTIDEKDFYQRFLDAKFYAVHATNSPKVIDKESNLTLFSRNKLIEKGISFPKKNTTLVDRTWIANDDNVFFSLEVGFAPSKNPRENKGSRFGNTIYKIPFIAPVFDCASMVLFDQIELENPRCHINGLSSQAKSLLERRFKPNPNDICFYDRKDILNSIALSIIEITRRFKEKDKKIILGASSDKEFNDILRSFFRIEIRVPNTVMIAHEKYFRFHFGS
ncbi:hypothetical protein [Xenorhabdus bharatensis]|uniref:hypothetical protein n=1 Tax=Xenorhabdus bharatensis TaxID=3136256 RepID=UPI0030F3C28C